MMLVAATLVTLCANPSVRHRGPVDPSPVGLRTNTLNGCGWAGGWAFTRGRRPSEIGHWRDDGRALLARTGFGWAFHLPPPSSAGFALRPHEGGRGRRRVVLDPYAHLLEKDLAVKDGRTYSDKAPGQPLFAVPFLISGRAIGFEAADEPREEGSIDLWWVTLWSATIFGAGLLVLMHRRVKETLGEFAVVAPMALFFGSMLLPFSGLLFGHVMAAFLLYASFLILQRGSRRGQLLSAGLLAGSAVLVEYTAAIGVALLTALVCWRGVRRAPWWLAGGALMAIPLGIYNQLAFGSPFRLSYQYSAFAGVVENSQPLFHMFSAATVENLVELMFSGRGLVVATPIMLCALAGGIARLRSRDIDAILGVGMFCAFLLVPILWSNPWGGASPGPRYMTPAIPFLAVPLAWAWKRWPMLTSAAVAVSVLTMASALIVQAMPYSGDAAGLGAWLVLLSHGLTADTLWTSAFGPWGWVLHAALVSVTLLFIWWQAKRLQSGLLQMSNS